MFELSNPMLILRYLIPWIYAIRRDLPEGCHYPYTQHGYFIMIVLHKINSNKRLFGNGCEGAYDR